MTSPLIQRLLDNGHALLVDEKSLPEFLQQHQHTLLFFAGDVRRYPESNDLAVILPELKKAFEGSFQVGLVDASIENKLQQQYGFTHWPTLVLLRGEAYLGAISKLQNWAEYCADIQRLMQSNPASVIPIIQQGQVSI